MSVEALTGEAFAPFGDVIEFEGSDFFPINNGMADRYHALAEVELGDQQSRAVISLVASRQFDMPRRVDHLEYHPLGSQAFLPLDACPFIVVVCAAASEPDLGQLRAFVTNGKQGINYRRGTWHHVLLTPYAPMRFICVDRAGPGNNCIDYHIGESEQPLLEPT
jgi:ureidoglycolate lyase